MSVDVVIAGYGVAGELHAHLLESRAGVRITGIADPLPQRRALAVERHPAAVTAESLDHLDVTADAVVIATPPADHERDVHTALTRFRAHVLCEKPAVLDPDRGRGLGEIAAHSGLVLRPAHNYLYAPAIRRVRQLIADGAIGPVTRVAVDIARSRPSPGHTGWRTGASAGGGILNDHGPHAIYLVHHLLGQPADTVSCTTRLDERGVDHTAAVQLTFPGPVIADISLTWKATERRTRYQIRGTDGTLMLHRGRLTHTARSRTRSDPTDNLAAAGHTHAAWTRALHADFIAGIAEGEATHHHWKEAIHVAELLRAARISASP